ncbi:MAG: PAS domain S-box protein [Variovorax sp.]|nr:MAG: PAS domain S-box protein [Variovorax sp.]
MTTPPSSPIASRHDAAADARRLRAIFQSAIDYAIIATDIDGLTTDWNAGAEAIFGWTAQEMVGHSARRFFTPEDRATGQIEKEMTCALLTGRGNDERWHLRKDGSRFWGSGEMTTLRDADGTHIGFLKILRDATKARKAAVEQHADSEFLRSVLASSNDCIKVLDLEARLTFMSEGGQAVMEVSDFNAVRGCPWPDFWKDAGNVAAVEALEAARAGGLGHFQGKADTLRGNSKWWDVQVTPILGIDGRPDKLLAISRDITTTMEAQLALRRAQELNASVLNSSRDCIMVLDLAGRVEFVSPGGLRAMDAEGPSDLLGTSWFEAWRGTDHDAAREAMRAASAGGTGRFEGYAPTLRGVPKWWDCVVSAICDTDGKPERMVVVGRDITTRRTVEQRLAQSEERLNLALGASGMVGIWDWDLKADIIYADANFARIYTVDPAWAAQGAPLSEYVRNFHPDDMPAFQAELARTFAGKDEFLNEYRILQPDGSVRWILARGRVVRDADGVPVRFPGASVDVTERKQSEIAIQRLNETLEQRVEARTRERDRAWAQSRDLQLVIETDGTIRSVNDAWHAVLGWKAEDLLGHDCKDLIDVQDLPADGTAIGTALSAKGVPSENRLRHKEGGSRWLSWVAVQVDGLVYASGRHITAEKEAAASLAAMQEQLRQSQKMEAVGQLTGGLAHDFNNLLASITGSLELMQRRLVQGRHDGFERYISVAQGAARRAASLTHRMLAFSRRQTLEPKTTDVNKLVAGMEELLRRTIGPAVTLEVVGAVGLWRTNVDPHQLENALLNLCINARDAMPDGGRLTIETANRHMDDRMARERDLPPGQYISLCVTDTGTGMPPEVIQRVFEPFFTTKPMGMGTGLGLSMVYGFARQSGGQIRVYSELGMGTTMCVYLPRQLRGDDETDAPSTDLAQIRAQGTGAGVVLVVDDEVNVRSLVVEVLEELGFMTLQAGDGAEALTLLQSGVPIDLLITDVGLPGGMNGRQVADGGRVLRPDLKVLFITGYAENAVVGNGHLEPGMQVLTKPFTLDALALRVNDLVTGPALRQP